MILFQILFERNFPPLLPTYFIRTHIHSFELLHSHPFSISLPRSLGVISEKDDLFKY